MWTYGFFNSVDGDRTYNADQMSDIFEGLISDGVYESVGNKLAVQPNTGMAVQIASGRGWFNRRWVNNSAPYVLAISASDVTLNRYAAVVIKVDTTSSARSATPYIKYSDFATNPVKPAMTRNETVSEYCLAYVMIRAGATAITSADIEDTRFNNELCGWVTGLINQLDTSTLYTQWEELFNGFMTTSTENFNSWLEDTQGDFNDWFETLQVTLDDEVATRLTAALPTTTTVILQALNWSAGSQTVQVVGMNATKSVVVQPAASTAAAYRNAGIKCVAQGNNTLMFTCSITPTSNISVEVLHMGE